MTRGRELEAVVERLDVAAYTVPTEEPESDATLAWEETTIVVVEAHGGGDVGLGYTYADVTAGPVIVSRLAGAVTGADALLPQAAWTAMRTRLRNAGAPGIAAMAMAAVDLALHDLRARLLGLPLARALGGFRTAVAIYGSGGFTSYSLDRLREQLGGWATQGISRVKMKVGRDPAGDLERLAAARDAIGDAVELMVDANGAFTPAEALRWAERYAEFGVTYFEEPVTQDDPDGLRRVRDGAPAGMAIASGEYVWGLSDAARLLEAEAVDILQADVTRCAGLTELVRIDALCKARALPSSAHTAPAVSAHAACATETMIHVEHFFDHVRLERMLFDGTLEPEAGELRPDTGRPGVGLELKRADAEPFLAWRGCAEAEPRRSRGTT